MEDLIAGVFSKDALLKEGISEESIKELTTRPHLSPFKVETWFTILNSFTNKTIRTDGYYYAIKKHPASILVAATLEGMNSARVAQGVVPENEPERSESLQMISPYIFTMAGLIKEDCYSGSKMWNVDTLDLANRVFKRSKNNQLPLKNVEGKKYMDDKIDMFVEYLTKDLNTVPAFVEQVEAAKKNYGEIASQLNLGGVGSENKAVKLFINTFRKPSDGLVALRIEVALLENQINKIKNKMFSNGKKLATVQEELNDKLSKLELAELLG